MHNHYIAIPQDLSQQIDSTYLTGKFTLYSENGEIYKGMCIDGIPSGKGKMTYSNNCTWEGEWNYGKRNGSGHYFLSDTVWYDGIWKDDHCMSKEDIVCNNLTYHNEQHLFNRETLSFSFMSQKEAILASFNWFDISLVDITPDDCTFLLNLIDNPIFLIDLFSSQCITATIDIQSLLDTTQLSTLLSFISFIPTLKTVRISSLLFDIF